MIPIGTGFGLGKIFNITAQTVSRGPDQLKGLLLYGFAFLTMLLGAVFMLMLFYRMWEVIQDGNARTAPGKAVGFLFIPLFNIYWSFQAIWGYAKDYNSFIDRYEFNVPKLPEWLFLTHTILSFTGWLPHIGLFLVLLNYFIGLIMVSKICDAVNALPDI